MNDNLKEIKMVENGLVIILLFVIITILLPSVTSLVAKSLQLSAQTSTQGTIDMVKSLYTTINLTDEVNLPFKVIYNKDGYTIYSDNKKYTPKEEIKVSISGKMPTGGSVEITTGGQVTVKDLKFGSITCNQINNNIPVCEG